MIDFGIVRPGTTLYIPFATYDSNDPTASVTMTGFAVTDIEIYKDGGTTQRASDNGYALLDTDGTDFDGLTGIHGFSIDLADNSTSGFYVAGSQYWVVVSSITVDAGAVSFIAATFRIGLPDAVYNTTIATLASQTSFTLTAGPAEDNALVGCVCYIHDIASAVQCGFAVISAYTGSTKTVTLTAGVSFTAAAGDNISIFPPVNAKWLGATALTGRDIGASVLLSPGTGTGQVSLSSGAVTVGTNNDKTGYSLSAAGIQAIWDALTSALTTVGSIGKRLVDYITGDIYARLGAPSGASVSADIASVKTDTGTTIPGRLPTALVSGRIDASVGAMASGVVTATAIATDAITADKIAADAIGSSELASTAVAEIADAVWDEVRSGHTTPGTYGEVSTAGDLADAVWDEARSGHTTGGSFGEGIASVQGNVTGSVGSVASGGITAASIATDAIDADALAANAVDEILDEVVEGTVTLRQAIRLFLSALTGKASGGGTTTITFRDIGDTKDRIIMTVDSSGNRSAVGTRDGS